MYGFTSKKHNFLYSTRMQKQKINKLEFKNPYEQIFLGHPVYFSNLFCKKCRVKRKNLKIPKSVLDQV